MLCFPNDALHDLKVMIIAYCLRVWAHNSKKMFFFYKFILITLHLYPRVLFFYVLYFYAKAFTFYTLTPYTRKYENIRQQKIFCYKSVLVPPRTILLLLYAHVSCSYVWYYTYAFTFLLSHLLLSRYFIAVLVSL